MTCEQVAREEMLEKYLRNGLSEAERDTLEQHYLECAHCFEQLKALRAVHAALGRSESAIRLEPLAAPTLWQQKWVWAAAASVVLLAAFAGIAIWRATAPVIAPPVATTPAPNVPVPNLSELAAFQPPPYSPIILRGPADEAALRYREAMQHYARGDYRGAIPGLRAASLLDPKASRIQFFLGTCYLLTEDNAAGIDALKKTIELGKSPFLEGAHFYLAKAYLRTGNIEGAREQLELTVQQRGDLQSEADRLLLELAKLSRSPH